MNTSKKLTRKVLVTSIAGCVAMAGNAAAELEEIIVTATKRAASMQEVPMSISAVSGDSIDRIGATDFTDIATSVPSLSLRSSGPGRTKLNIRGISSATGFAPTVSFYIDEMPVSSISSGSSTSFAQTIIDPKLYDLERVEVLRGPQGTLYGSSSMGGTVRLITAQPTTDGFSARLTPEVSTTSNGGINSKLNAMVNMPLSDTVALRVVASSTNNSGHFDRVSRDDGSSFAKDVNSEDTDALRASLRWEMDEDSYLQTSVFTQSTKMDGKPNYDGLASDFQQVRRFDAAEPFDDEFTMVSMTYGRSMEKADLLMTYSNLDRSFNNVEDLTDATDCAFNSCDPMAPGAVYSDEKVDLDDETIEVRLSSNGDSALQWVAGYYSKDAAADAGYRMQRGFEFMSSEGLANTQDLKTYQETAMFGELTYSFNDQLDLTVGARSLDYDFTQYKEDWGFVYGDTNRAASNVLDLTADDSDTSIKVTGSYQLSEDGQIYATYSDGSRPGGGNRSIPRSTDASNSTAYACDQDLNALGINGSPDVYEGDSVKNNEFGIKTMLNDSIRFNAAIYRMTWENIQQSVTTSGACGFNFTANLGEAESTGAEIEMNAAVNDNLNINFSLGYTVAEFKQNVASAGISSGDQLGDVPELTYNINVDYVIPADGGQFFIVGNYNWVDETLELPGLASDDVSGQGIISGNVKPDYGILGLRAGFTSDNNWEAVVFIDNATDETAIYSYSDAIAFNLPLYDRTVRNQPRTIGMNVTYSW